jgi:transcriptional regulator with XRE-family HTH domain
MGKRGPAPKASRRTAAKLRAHGWTLQRIAAHLGVTHQRVSRLLKDAHVPPRPVRCRECGAIILDRPHGSGVRTSVWCLACLGRHPEAPFGERVKAFRLATGLTQRQLAEQLGIVPTTIGRLEAGATQPERRLREALIRRFGQALERSESLLASAPTFSASSNAVSRLLQRCYS